MPKVKVKSTINHDGVIYEPGEVFECTPKQAQALCELGSAQMAGKAADVEDDAEGATPAVLKPAKAAAKAKGGK